MDLFNLITSLNIEEKEALKTYVDQEVEKLRQEIKKNYISKRDHENWMKSVLGR